MIFCQIGRIFVTLQPFIFVIPNNKTSKTVCEFIIINWSNLCFVLFTSVKLIHLTNIYLVVRKLLVVLIEGNI